MIDQFGQLCHITGRTLPSALPQQPLTSSECDRAPYPPLHYPSALPQQPLTSAMPDPHPNSRMLDKLEAVGDEVGLGSV